MRALNIERDIYLKCTERGKFVLYKTYLSYSIIDTLFWISISSKGVRDNYEKTEYDKLLRNYEADGLESNDNYESVSDWTEVDAKYALDGFGFAFFDVEVRSGGYLQPNKRYIQVILYETKFWVRMYSLIHRYNKKSIYIIF